MIASIIAYLIFCYIILSSNFFSENSIHKYAMPFFFTLKILAGIVLYFIYNHFYENRATGDVNKYFDDAIQIYKSLDGNVKDYFKILFNINCNEQYMQKYFEKIDHWEVFGNSNFINDARTVIRFNLLLLPISKGYYYFHSIIINFISFAGLTFIYNVFCNISAHKKFTNALVCFLMPSILFWCSGVLKESLLVFFLGLAIHSIHKIFFQHIVHYFKYILILLLGLFGILITKFYVLFALLPAIIFLVIQKQSRLKLSQIALIIYASATAFLLIDSLATQKIITPLAQKQKEFVNVARGGYYFEQIKGALVDTIYINHSDSNYLIKRFKKVYTIKKGCPAFVYRKLEFEKSFEMPNNNKNVRLLSHLIPANSYIYLPTLNSTFFSLLKTIPVALFNSIFLPTFFNLQNAMYILPALENFILMLLLITCLLKQRKIDDSSKLFLWFCSIFCFNLLVIIGITTPVLGALVRYKVPALPFIFYLVLSFINFDFLKKNMK